MRTHTLPNLNLISTTIAVPYHLIVEELPERTFPERLRKARLERGLTQKGLSLRAGVSKDLVYRWENGLHGALRRTLTRVAAVLGITVEYLRDGPVVVREAA